jgi:hypothetical protein
MSHEREFLRLARDYLLCRLFVFGGVCPQKAGQYSFDEWLIGMFSYEREMQILCQEVRRR